jgi:hypothetical protein
VQFAGLVVAFLGMGAAFAESLWAGGGSLEGDLLCLLGGALWATTTLCVRASRTLSSAAPATILWLQLAGSIPILFAAAWWQGEVPPFPTVSPLGWLGLFYQTVQTDVTDDPTLALNVPQARRLSPAEKAKKVYPPQLLEAVYRYLGGLVLPRLYIPADYLAELIEYFLFLPF